MSDLLGSIIPEKVTFEGGVVRTPWGAAVSRLFRPKMQNADSVAEPASRVVARRAQLFEPNVLESLERIALFVRKHPQLLPPET